MSRFFPNIPNMSFMNKKPSTRLIELTKIPGAQPSSIASLLDKGDDPFLKDENQKSAFDYALEAENLEIAHLMFQHPKYKKEIPEEARTNLKKATIEVIDKKKDDLNSLNKIIDFSKNSSIEEVNSKALFYTMKSENPNLSKISSLLENSANPYAEYGTQESAFQIAINNNKFEIAHLIYALSENPDYKDLLENRTIAELRQNRDNSHNIAKIVNFDKKNLMPKIRKQAEIIIYEEGLKIIPQKNMDIIVNGVKTTIKTEGDIVITPEIIEKFSKFIDQKPLLGSDLSEQNKECFIRLALNFALDNFDKNPDLLSKVTNLIQEQNPNDKQLKQKITDILVEHSNNNISSYRSAIQIDSLIKLMGEKITNYSFGNLSEEHKEALINISEFMNKKNIQSIPEDALKEDVFENLHRNVQLLQGTNLPKELLSNINSNIIKITQNYFNKQVKDENIEAISRMSKVACNTKSYMSFMFYTDETQDAATLEGRHVNQLIQKIIGNDIDKLNESQLEKFSKLLDKNPSIGNIEDEKSLGRIVLDISVLYAKQKPELLEKVTKIMKDNQISNEQSSYNKGMMVIGGSTDHLSQKQLEAFINFLETDPAPILGDVNNDKNLGKMALEIADKYPKNKTQILDIYNSLIEKEVNLRNVTTTHFIEGSNLSLDEQQRKSLTNHILKNLYKELACEDQRDISYLLSSTAEAKNTELLNSIILANKGNIKSTIEHTSLEDLFNNGYKESTKELLYSPEVTSRYLDLLSKDRTINNDLIKFVYDNKANGTVINSPRTIEALVDIASKTQDYKMLSEVVHNTISTKDELLINSSLTEILKNKDLKYFNSLIGDISSSETMTANQKHTFSQTILKDEKYINSLHPDTIQGLAPYYNPKIDSPKFLAKLIDQVYVKGDSREQLIPKMQLALIKTDQQSISNQEEFNKSFDKFLEIKTYHEKKPIMTMIKAFISGKSSKDYKHNQIDSALSIVKNNLESCIVPYTPQPEPLVDKTQNAKGQAIEMLKGKSITLALEQQADATLTKKTTTEQIEEIKTYAGKALKTAFTRKQQDTTFLSKETSGKSITRH